MVNLNVIKPPSNIIHIRMHSFLMFCIFHYELIKIYVASLCHLPNPLSRALKWHQLYGIQNQKPLDFFDQKHVQSNIKDNTKPSYYQLVLRVNHYWPMGQLFTEMEMLSFRNFSSLAAQEVVILMTTFSAASDVNLINMTKFSFKYGCQWVLISSWIKWGLYHRLLHCELREC